MKNECTNIHLPNFSSTCCIRHLVEMSKFADMQMLTKKYAKLLLEVLNHNYKLNHIQYSKMKLDLFLGITDVITKYISYFFLINKLDYAKLLGKICIQGFKETAFKDHPDVILRQIAINNNISCIYEAKSKLKKAFYYLNKNKEFVCLSTNLDNAIMYNNLIRICYRLNSTEELMGLLKDFTEALEEEAKNSKACCMKQVFELSSTISFGNIVLTQSEFTAKNQMISFLYYNLGIALEKFGKCDEGMEAFTKGYEYAMSVLGEHHLYTHKFRTKLNLKMLQNKTDDGINHPKQKLKAQSLNKTMNIEKIKMHNKPKSFSINKSQYNFNESHCNNRNKGMGDEYKQKLDIIYDFIINQHEIQESRKIQSETEPSSSYIKNIQQHRDRDNKAYTQLKDILQPFLHKCINQNQNFNALQPTTKTQKSLIDEVLREFKNEVEVSKKRYSINKQGSSSETAVSIQTVKKPIHTQISQKTKMRFKKEGDSSNSNSNRNNNSQFIPHSFEINKGSLNSKFTFKEQTGDDFKTSDDEGSMSRRNKEKVAECIKNVKTKSTSLSCFHRPPFTDTADKDKAVIPSVNIILDNSEVPYEMKPFYSPNEAYKNTVQNLVISQKNVKFLRKSNEDQNQSSSIQDLLKGAMSSKSNNNLSKQSLPSSTNNNNDQESFKVISYNYSNTQANIDKSSSENYSSVNVLNIRDYIESEDVIPSSSSSLHSPLFNQYLASKLNSKDNQSNLFDRLIKQSSNKNSFCISTLFLFQNNYMKIKIMQKASNAPIVFLLYDFKDTSKVLSEIAIDLLKLKGILDHVNLYKTLPRFIDLNQLNTIENLMKKVLVYHCNIIKSDTKYTTGICPKPNSICGNKQMAVKFLKTQCTIDLIVIGTKIMRIIISYVKCFDVFLIIDLYSDESSFEALVSAIPNQRPVESNETFIPVYQFNEKQMSKDGLVRLILKKTQDIIKYKTNNQDITLIDLQRELKDYLFQCTIRDNCTRVNFLDIALDTTYTSSLRYFINHWSFTKPNEDGEFYMKHSILHLDDYRLNSLFNSNASLGEFKQIYDLLNEREKEITHYLLLNSFECDNNNHLTLIKPIVQFNYTTLVNGDRVNDPIFLINIHIAQYTKTHYMGKLIYYNQLSNYEYSIILLPSLMYQSIEDVIITISLNKRKLSAVLIEVYKECIEKENVPMVKFIPITSFTNKLK